MSGIASTIGQGYKRFLGHANYASQDLQQLKPAANVSHFTSQCATVSSNTTVTVPANKGIKRVLVHDNTAISKPAKAVCVDSTVHVTDTSSICKTSNDTFNDSMLSPDKTTSTSAALHHRILTSTPNSKTTSSQTPSYLSYNTPRKVVLRRKLHANSVAADRRKSQITCLKKNTKKRA